MTTSALTACPARKCPAQKTQKRYTLTLGTQKDRTEIYRIRHQIYAAELRQHPTNTQSTLNDALDGSNQYIVARSNNKIVGFISITPPTAGKYSIEKYYPRDEFPFTFHEKLYEVRLLTVLPALRKGNLALLLSYAALRWVHAHGGTHICGMGRSELLGLYRNFGLNILPLTTKSGRCAYHMMHAAVERLITKSQTYSSMLRRLEKGTDWQLVYPFLPVADCFHGGAFFQSIGVRFQTLERKNTVINADVLDAWFPPAPAVQEILTEHLSWLLRTSPPTGCEGLIQTIAQYRGVHEENILPGAGSSDLIFRALRHFLDQNSRVLILDPTYGEYRHVLDNVIGCHVQSFSLSADDNYQVHLQKLESALKENYDLLILVNPNSPTGQHIPKHDLEDFLRRVPIQTRVWIDETYVDYLPGNASLEKFTATSENIIVCKSMSKVYALSGARVAYLCAGAHQLESLRAITPPWVVSLIAQVAAIKALENAKYYATCYAQTHALRKELAKNLTALGWRVIPGLANFLLCTLPLDGPDTRTFIESCRAQHLFLRDPGNMGGKTNTHLIRIAVKDAETNARILDIIRSVSHAEIIDTYHVFKKQEML